MVIKIQMQVNVMLFFMSVYSLKYPWSLHVRAIILLNVFAMCVSVSFALENLYPCQDLLGTSALS